MQPVVAGSPAGRSASGLSRLLDDLRVYRCTVFAVSRRAMHTICALVSTRRTTTTVLHRRGTNRSGNCEGIVALCRSRIDGETNVAYFAYIQHVDDNEFM